MTRAISFDEMRYPIVVVTFVGLATDVEFDNYLRGLDEIFARRQKVVTIVDATLAEITPAGQRQKQAAWLKTNVDVLRRYSLGTALVFTSPIFRFVLSTMFVVQPLPTPYVVVGQLDDALVWASTQVKNSRPPAR
jgi:hypothetical protein